MTKDTNDPHGGIISYQEPADPHGWIIQFSDGASLDDLIDQARTAIAQGDTPRVEIATDSSRTLERARAALGSAGLESVEVRRATSE